MSIKEYKRADRIADLFQMELATILKRHIDDPRLKNITITLVKVSDDLSIAKVYFTMLEASEEKIRHVLKGLKSASGFFRSHLAKVIQTRKVPNLVFYYDDHIDRVHNMTTLIEKTVLLDQVYSQSLDQDQDAEA